MKQWVKDIAKVITVTLITVGLSRMITYVPLNVSFFASSSITDINQFDIYSELQQSQGIMPFENKVVVVTLPHNASRYELAEALFMLADCNPAAISVDIDLSGEKDAEIDSLLKEAIRANHNVVFPCKLDCLADTAEFFANAAELGISRGYSNLDNRDRDNAVIRSFTPFFINGTDTIFSLPLQAVRQIYPEKVKELIKRGHKHEYINFLVDITTIPYNEIPDWADMLKYAIVMLGVDTQADLHRSSIDMQMLGLNLHAYAASTVIGSRYINSLPPILTEIIILSVIILFVYYNIFFVRLFSRTSGFFVRTSTYILFFTLMILSYVIFAEYSIYLDCGWFLLAIAFAPWALDTYNICNIACEKIRNFAKRHNITISELCKLPLKIKNYINNKSSKKK